MRFLWGIVLVVDKQDYDCDKRTSPLKPYCLQPRGNMLGEEMILEVRPDKVGNLFGVSKNEELWREREFYVNFLNIVIFL